MIIKIPHKEKIYHCNLAKPIDISIPLGQVKCFYATDFEVKAYTSGNFVGAVKAGAPVNFFDVQMNPHGNGTHTEGLGHITEAQEAVNEVLKQYHFIAQVVSVEWTEIKNGDQVISYQKLQAACPEVLPDALVLRTLPNSKDKLTKDYSGTNPPYLEAEAISFLVEQGVQHLLLDLPSVDREVDEGKLLNHRLFWKVEGKTATAVARKNCTITELIFVPDEVKNGLYLLNIQIPSMPLDAAPSKPVLYELY
ncbi:MAG: cyclase family protein [Bacteroidota bacterium]